MKGLTLTEPWATLMAIRAKMHETRSWSTQYRGLIAIHSAKGWPKDAQILSSMDPFKKHVKPAILHLNRSHILAVGVLTNVLPTVAEYDTRFSLSEEYAFGDYSPNRFIWIFENMQRLAHPIRFKGSLGLWNVPTEIEAQIKEQLPTLDGKNYP